MKPDFTLDCYGLLCPMPVFKASQKIKELETGQVLEIISTDDGIKSDIKAWCEKTGNELLKIDEDDGEIHTFIRKLTPDELVLIGGFASLNPPFHFINFQLDGLLVIGVFVRGAKRYPPITDRLI